MKRLQLNCDLEPQPIRVEAQLPDRFYRPVPLITRRNHLLVPDILPKDQQKVSAPEVVGEIEISLRSPDMEAPHGRIEIGYTERTTYRRDHRQVAGRASVTNRSVFLRRKFEGVGEDINGVETNVF